MNIPDANFKAELVANTAINTNMDAEIQVSEAQAYTGTINVFNKNIASLIGIKAFTALTVLNCAQNLITSLDVTNNINLTTLSCSNNQLTSLNVANNINLVTLICSFNAITSIDVSSNLNLELFWCNVNLLTAIDISNNTSLNNFSCASNSLTSLDLTNNISLVELTCQNNDLTDLDVSVNTMLTKVHCNLNNLSSLNLKNGYNFNILNANFNATSNPNLLCIQVDSIAYSVANWTNKDATASYSKDCSTFNNINTISAVKINLTASPNPTTGILNLNFDQIEENFTIEVRNIMGQLVSSKNQTPTSSVEIELT